MSPAPIRTDLARRVAVKWSRTLRSTSEATETGVRPIAVSVRTRVATRPACSKRPSRQGPERPRAAAVLDRAAHLADDLALSDDQALERRDD